MPKLVIGMQTKRGFTLIEILVVLLIVGITLGFALLAFGDFGSKRRIITAAEQFVNYVKFAQQQAILETSTLGISLNRNSYQILRYQASSNWQPVSNKRVFHAQHFPDSAIVHMESNVKKMGNPQIIINASGDMTSFTLNFGSAKQVNIANVIGKHDGSVALQILSAP